jgi:hypothetical protein
MLRLISLLILRRRLFYFVDSNSSRFYYRNRMYFRFSCSVHKDLLNRFFFRPTDWGNFCFSPPDDSIFEEEGPGQILLPSTLSGKRSARVF